MAKIYKKKYKLQRDYRLKWILKDFKMKEIESDKGSSSDGEQL